MKLYHVTMDQFVTYLEIVHSPVRRTGLSKRPSVRDSSRNLAQTGKQSTIKPYSRPFHRTKTTPSSRPSVVKYWTYYGIFRLR